MAAELPLRVESAPTFTRPNNTTAYALGQLVANSTTAGSVVPLAFNTSRSMEGSYVIRRARISKSTTSVTNSQFRLHVYATSPVASNGDGGVWLTTEAGYIGFIDITVDKAFTASAVGHGYAVYNTVQSQLANRNKNPSSNLVSTASAHQVFGLLEARAAYTPGALETFTVSIEVEGVT